MQIKTSELRGIALDWAVATCDGWIPDMEKGTLVRRGIYGRHFVSDLPYSTDWSQGGPIIEREKIDILTEKKANTDSWFASVARYQDGSRLVGWRLHEYGATPLIAAMRCYVASKLGDTVDIPDGLM